MSFCATAARRTVFALATGHSAGARFQHHHRSALAVIRVTGPDAHSAVAALAGWATPRLLPETTTTAASASTTAAASIVAESMPLSGTDGASTGEVVQQHVRSSPRRLPHPRRLVRAALRDPFSGRALDDAMVVLFPGPRSATGEDVAELHVHGSPAVTAGVLRALGALDGKSLSTTDTDVNAERAHSSTISRSTSSRTAGVLDVSAYDNTDSSNTETFGSNVPCGSRKMEIGPAPAGEFMRRAFANGKMDLAAIEGVADLLAATTAVQASTALAQVRGALSELCAAYSRDLLRALAFVEAAIDFGEDEDVGQEVVEHAIDVLGPLLRRMQTQLSNGRRVGERLRDGFRCVIIGPPNAGKSSLLNCLLQREAALVSATPGTTRDIVEAPVDIAGFPVLLGDTAGVRNDDGVSGTLDVSTVVDPIEREGIRRALERAATADVKLCTLDVVELLRVGISSASPLVWDVVRSSPDALVILNKVDRLPEQLVGSALDKILAMIPDERTRSLLLQCHAAQRLFLVSCRTHQGIDSFLIGIEMLLQRKVTEEASSRDAEGDPDRFSGAVFTRQRHQQHLQDACEAVQYALDSACDVVLVAEGLRRAIRSIGMISGAADVEDMLDVVFAEFCIGK